MKKTYSKPDIAFENFSLCSSIAGTCERITDLPSRNGCGMRFGADTIFVNDTTGCSWHFEGGKIIGLDIGNLNGLCYDVPAESYTLFQS